MRQLYNFSVRFYGFAISISALLYPKAAKWKSGRVAWKLKLKEKTATKKKWIHVHCASLGEFEQGRIIIDSLKEKYPEHGICLTFFSPSGYEIRKDYKQADYVCYLPLDTPDNAKQFVAILNPVISVFIKYELWINILLELSRCKIPTYLVSAKMLRDSKFFRSSFSNLYKEVFNSYEHIFTQDEETAKLISDFSGQKNISVTGDTRFDRVIQLADQFEEILPIKKFLDGNPCLVAGSIWPNDEKILKRTFSQMKVNPMRWIMVPHEIRKKEILHLCETKKEIMVAYSQFDQKHQPWHRMLWIDNVGMLSRIYHYADVAYLGGGFDAGIHNILEAAVYGCPIIFGPKYKKFKEAVELVEMGGAISIDKNEDLGKVIRIFTEDEETHRKIRKQNQEWVLSKAGASKKVLTEIKKKIE